MEDNATTIFLVDDDELEVMWLTRQIAKLDLKFNFLHARDGEDALELLRSEQVPFPHIILLDINMPRMDGHEFLALLRENPTYKTSVVFMMTSSEAVSDKKRAYEKNVAGYLLKSIQSSSENQLGTLIQCYCKSVQMPPSPLSDTMRL